MHPNSNLSKYFSIAPSLNRIDMLASNVELPVIKRNTHFYHKCRFKRDSVSQKCTHILINWNYWIFDIFFSLKLNLVMRSIQIFGWSTSQLNSHVESNRKRQKSSQKSFAIGTKWRSNRLEEAHSFHSIGLSIEVVVGANAIGALRFVIFCSRNCNSHHTILFLNRSLYLVVISR